MHTYTFAIKVNATIDGLFKKTQKKHKSLKYKGKVIDQKMINLFLATMPKGI
tara:strand:- start:16064 stop:16219 length:156 start_codon:yes stop_codon:yes gene_type:complete